MKETIESHIDILTMSFVSIPSSLPFLPCVILQRFEWQTAADYLKIGYQTKNDGLSLITIFPGSNGHLFLGVNPPLLAVPNPPHPQFLVQVHKICQLTSNKGSQGGIWRDRRLGRNIGPVVVQKRSLRAPRTQEAGVLQDSFIHV